MPAKVSINILSYNGLKYLPHCLDSIQKQTFKDFEVIIIDNASTDGSVDFIRENYPQFRLIPQKTNLGFCEGHNLAFSLSKSPYILCLNQDIILEPDFLNTLITFAEQHPRAGAFTGRVNRWNFILNQKTSEIDSLGLQIFKSGQAIDWGQWTPPAPTSTSKPPSAPAPFPPTIPTEIFGPSGCAPLYRRSALEDVGYFDPDFFAYKEDLDLACRLRLRNWEAYLIPSAVCYHDRSIARHDSLIKNRRQKSAFANYHSYRNHLFYLIKNLPAAHWFFYGWRVLTYEFSKLIYIILFEPKTFLAFLDFIAKSVKMLTKRNYTQKRRLISFSAWRRWLN